MDYKLPDAINDYRVHHTFSTNVIYSEIHHPLPDNVVDNLRAKGHVVTDSMLDAVIQAVYIDRKNHRIYAESDPWKKGKASGY